jgi:pimeloyl-ACP methyl ester carboxylesterase
LENWPIPFETRYISTRYGDTFVIAGGAGTAPTLVLLHGAGTNSAIWAGDVAAYSRYYRVYAVDLLGEPGKSAPNRPAWDSPAYAEWLEDVFDALEIERATILGISQGGWTALKFATYQPERVQKLVLMCPGGVAPDRLSFLIRVVPLSLLGEWGTRRIVRMLYGSQPIPDGVEEITTLVTRHFKARMGVLPIFSDAELQRLTMPTLVLGGAQDALRDMDKIGARLQELLPHAQVTILPEGGHALLNTTEHVLSFLGAEAPD